MRGELTHSPPVARAFQATKGVTPALSSLETLIVRVGAGLSGMDIEEPETKIFPSGYNSRN